MCIRDRLVLDDADAVDALGDLVLDLRESYPALTVLATSVRPLRVRDERVLALKPFATTDAAVELFAARASAADASFRLFPSTSFFNAQNPQMSFFGPKMEDAAGLQTSLRVGAWWRPAS